MEKIYAKSSLKDGRYILVPLLNSCSVSDMKSYKKLVKTKAKISEIIDKIESKESDFFKLLSLSNSLSAGEQKDALLSILVRLLTLDKDQVRSLLIPSKKEEDVALEEGGFFDDIFSMVIDVTLPVYCLEKSATEIIWSDDKTDEIVRQQLVPTRTSGVPCAVAFTRLLTESTQWDTFLRKLFSNWLSIKPEFSCDSLLQLLKELAWTKAQSVEPEATDMPLSPNLQETQYAPSLLGELSKAFAAHDKKEEENKALVKILEELVKYILSCTECQISLGQETETLLTTRSVFKEAFAHLWRDAKLSVSEILHNSVAQNTEEVDEVRLKATLELLLLLAKESENDSCNLVKLTVVGGILKKGISTCYLHLTEIIQRRIEVAPELFSELLVFVSDQLTKESFLSDEIVAVLKKINAFCRKKALLEKLAIQETPEFKKCCISFINILGHPYASDNLVRLIFEQLRVVVTKAKALPTPVRSSLAVKNISRHVALCSEETTVCFAYILSDGRAGREKDFQDIYRKDLFDFSTFLSIHVRKNVFDEMFRLCACAETEVGASAAERIIDIMFAKLGQKEEKQAFWNKFMRLPGLLLESKDTKITVLGKPSTLSRCLTEWIKIRSSELLNFVRDQLGSEKPLLAAVAALQLVSAVLGLSGVDEKRLVEKILPKMHYSGRSASKKKPEDCDEAIDLFRITERNETVRQLMQTKQEDLNCLAQRLRAVRDNAGGTATSVEVTKDPTNTVCPEGERINVFGQAFERLQPPEGFENHVPPISGKLVCVPSTKRNVLRILQSLVTQSPKLLEGDTGAGKSAAVSEAARLVGAPLIRFNMSRSVTCSDIIGHVALSTQKGSLIKFEDGPFTTAYKNGIWLLLDELNLASDEVLQCIESAIDNDCLIIEDYASDRVRVSVKKHANFRLFATQNPNSGGFKGMRQVLSNSFVSRFLTLSLDPPTNEELIKIVRKLFVKSIGKQHKPTLSSWAKRMVDFHDRIQTMSEKNIIFAKEGPYATFTVRELLKWVDSVIATVLDEEMRSITVTSNEKQIHKMLAFEAVCIYETRFCSEECRKCVHMIIHTHFRHTEEGEDLALKFLCTPTKNVFELQPYLKLSFDCDSDNEEDDNVRKFITFHRMLSTNLLSSQNCILFPFSVPEWVRKCRNYRQLGRKSAAFYQAYIPSRLDETIKIAAERCFKVSELDASASASAVTEFDPFVVSPYIMRLWLYVLHAIKHCQPVLLVGPPGSGKSEIILQLAVLLAKCINVWCITPDTEASDLVGKVVPGEPARWNDGVVTKSVKNGEWVLLDNLLDADAAVLERLNPLLEKDPAWVLTENGETVNLFRDQNSRNFRFLATACTSESDKIYGKMSPALANRMTIIYVEDCAFSDAAAKMGPAMFAWSLYSSNQAITAKEELPEWKALKETAFFLAKVRSKFSRTHGGPLVNLRSLTRIVRSAKRISVRLHCPLSSALYASCQMGIVQQLSEAPAKDLAPELKTLQTKLSGRVNSIDFLDQENLQEDPAFILDEHLTPTRYQYGNTILFGVIASLPILLEGPAATGKTSLIESIRVRQGNQTTLYRVINSDSTSIQDYVGTFVPCGNGKFEKLNGPLKTAMEEGGFFLSDEFNLADPSVLNMLLPLLEGRRVVYDPVSGDTIKAHDNFRFFATQNSALYADRKRLSVSLRSRFLEAQVKDFGTNELAFILQRRQYSFSKDFNPFSRRDELDQRALALEQAFHSINRLVKERKISFGEGAVSSCLTLREMIKWVERYSNLFALENNRVIGDLWGRAGLSLLVPRLRDSSSVSSGKAEMHLRDSLCSLNLFTANSPKFTSTRFLKTEKGYLLSDDYARCYFPSEKPSLLTLNPFQLSVLDKLSSDLNPKDYQVIFARMHMAIQSKEPVLLIGPTTFKTTIVEDYFLGRSQDFTTIQLSSDTQVPDLLGQMHPFSFEKAIEYLLEIAEQLLNQLEKQGLKNFEIVPFRLLSSQCKDVYKDLVASCDLCGDRNVAEKDKFEEGKGFCSVESGDNESDSSSISESADSYDNSDDDIGFRRNFLDSNDEDEDEEETDDDEDSENEEKREELEAEIDKMRIVNVDAVAKQGIVHSQDSEKQCYPKKSVMHVHLAEEKSKGKVAFLVEDSESDEDSENIFGSSSSDDENAKIEETRKGSDYSEEELLGGLEAELPNKSTFNFDVHSCFEELAKAFSRMSNKNSTVEFLGRKFVSTLAVLRKCSSDTSKPVFLFKDGPVTRAIKEGKSLFLEDINLPSQAVIERLNSLLEPGSILFLTEDVSVGASGVEVSSRSFPGIQMLPDSAIIGSVHLEASDRMKLSPALRSRFSEIVVRPTDIDDIEKVAKKFIQNLSLLEHEDRLVLVLKKLAVAMQKEKKSLDLKAVTTWLKMLKSLAVCMYPAEHDASSKLSVMDVNNLIVVVSKLTFVDNCFPKDRQCLIDTLLQTLGEASSDGFSQVDAFSQRIDANVISWLSDGARGLTGNKSLWEPLEILEADGAFIRFSKLPVSARVSSQIETEISNEYIKNTFKFTATPTCIDNMIRVLASLSSNMPLLLQGPPGIGKTAIVQQCGDLLGFPVERINFTKDTSLESLIGSFVPTWNGSRLLFEWRDGKALSALKNGHFLLLDEVNLASQEVLDELKAIVTPASADYFVFGLGVKILKHKDFRLFATMNPASVGGGRTKLPRSVENSFLSINLQEYEREEENQICAYQFNNQGLVPRLLKVDDVKRLLDFHFGVKLMISRREIGRQGGPYELNVRDLLKVGDVLEGNMENHLSHMELSSSEKNVYELDNARVISIRTAVSLVYCRLFNDVEDQEKVQQQIKKYFPFSNELSTEGSKRITLDASLPNSFRIGFVYLAKDVSAVPYRSLVLTTQLKDQLQTLGCAVASGRSIVLEGNTCSRKSALVCELARLCKRNLHVFSLNDETETDTLIGRWVPFKPRLSLKKATEKSLINFNETLHFLFTAGLRCISEDVMSELFDLLVSSVKQTWCAGLETFKTETDVADKLSNGLDALVEGINLVLLNSTDNEGKLKGVAEKQLSQRKKALIADSESLREKTLAIRSKLTAFEYVESALVSAVRNGEWVLLDNISAAPSGVVERLMSLTEANPSLKVYESPKSPLLTRKNKGIHPSFCLFSTVNSSRQSQGKLSSAFYNRVLRIWVPEVDDEAMRKQAKGERVTETELYQLVLGLIGDLPGGKVISEIIVLVHCRLKALVFNKQITTVGNVQITARSALRAAMQICRWKREESSEPFQTLGEVLEQCYIKCCVGKDQVAALKEILVVLQSTAFAASDFATSAMREIEDDGGDENDDYIRDSLRLREEARRVLLDSYFFLFRLISAELRQLTKNCKNNTGIKTALFCRETFEKLCRKTKLPPHLNREIECVIEFCAAVEEEETNKNLALLQRKVDEFSESWQKSSGLVKNVASAEVLKQFSGEIAFDLASLGKRLKKFLYNSTFSCITKRMRFALTIISLFEIIQDSVSDSSWLIHLRTMATACRSPDEEALEKAALLLQEGLLSLAQQGNIFESMKKFTQILSSLQNLFEVAISELAPESTKAFVLSLYHRIMQQPISMAAERKRLINFIIEKKILPTKFLLQLETITKAIEVLAKAIEKIPQEFFFSESSSRNQSAENALDDVSVYENCVDACKLLCETYSAFDLNIKPLLLAIRKLRQENNALAKASIDEKFSIAVGQLTQLKKNIAFSESSHRLDMLYQITVQSIHVRIFRALASQCEKKKVPRSMASSALIKSLLRQLSPHERNFSLGTLWKLVFFGPPAKFLFADRENWKVHLVMSEIDVERTLNSLKGLRHAIFVCSCHLETTNCKLILLNRPQKRLNILEVKSRSVLALEKAGEHEEPTSLIEIEEDRDATRERETFLKQRSSLESSQHSQNLEDTLLKKITSVKSESLRVHFVSLFPDSDQYMYECSESNKLALEILFILASFGGITAQHIPSLIKIQTEVVEEMSSLKTTDSELMLLLKEQSSDRHRYIRETRQELQQWAKTSDLLECDMFDAKLEENYNRQKSTAFYLMRKLKTSYQASLEATIPRSISLRHVMLSQIGRTLDRRLAEIGTKSAENLDNCPWDIRVLVAVKQKILKRRDVKKTISFSLCDRVIRLVKDLLHNCAEAFCSMFHSDSPVWTNNADFPVSLNKSLKSPEADGVYGALLPQLSKMAEVCSTVFCCFKQGSDNRFKIEAEQLKASVKNLEAETKEFEKRLLLDTTFSELRNIFSAVEDCVECFATVETLVSTEASRDVKEMHAESQRQEFIRFVDILTNLQLECREIDPPPLQYSLRLSRSIHDAKQQLKEFDSSMFLEKGPADVLRAKCSNFEVELVKLKQKHKLTEAEHFAFELDVRKACPDVEAQHKHSRICSPDLLNELKKSEITDSFESFRKLAELITQFSYYAIEETRKTAAIKQLRAIKSSTKGDKLDQKENVDQRHVLVEMISMAGVGMLRSKEYSEIGESIYEDPLNPTSLEEIERKVYFLFYKHRNETFLWDNWKHFSSYADSEVLCKQDHELVSSNSARIANALSILRFSIKRLQALRSFTQILSKDEVAMISPLFLTITDIYFLIVPCCSQKLANLAEAEKVSLRQTDERILLPIEEATPATGIALLLSLAGHSDSVASDLYFEFLNFIDSIPVLLDSAPANDEDNFQGFVTGNDLPEIRICTALLGLFTAKWAVSGIADGLQRNKSENLVASLSGADKEKGNYASNFEACQKLKGVLSDVIDKKLPAVSQSLSDTKNLFADFFQKAQGSFCDSFDASNDQQTRTIDASFLKNVLASFLLFTNGSGRTETDVENELKERLEGTCTKGKYAVCEIVTHLQDYLPKNEHREDLVKVFKLFQISWICLEGALKDTLRKASVCRQFSRIAIKCSEMKSVGDRFDKLSSCLFGECETPTRKYLNFSNNIMKVLGLSRDCQALASELSYWERTATFMYEVGGLCQRVAALTYAYIERREKANAVLIELEKKMVQQARDVFKNLPKEDVLTSLRAVRSEIAYALSQINHPLEMIFHNYSGNPFTFISADDSFHREVQSFWAPLSLASSLLGEKFKWIVENFCIEEGSRKCFQMAFAAWRKLRSQILTSDTGKRDGLLLACSELTESVKDVTNYLACTSDEAEEPIEKIFRNVHFISVTVFNQRLSIAMESFRKDFCRVIPDRLSRGSIELWHLLHLRFFTANALKDLAECITGENQTRFHSLQLLVSFSYESLLTLGRALQRTFVQCPLYTIDAAMLQNVLLAFSEYLEKGSKFLKMELDMGFQEFDRLGETTPSETRELLSSIVEGSHSLLEESFLTFYSSLCTGKLLPSFPLKRGYENDGIETLLNNAIINWNMSIDSTIKENDLGTAEKERGFFQYVKSLFQNEKRKYEEDLRKYNQIKEQRDAQRKVVEKYFLEAATLLLEAKAQSPHFLDLEGIGKADKSLSTLLQEYNKLLLKGNDQPFSLEKVGPFALQLEGALVLPKTLDLRRKCSWPSVTFQTGVKEEKFVFRLKEKLLHGEAFFVSKEKFKSLSVTGVDIVDHYSVTGLTDLAKEAHYSFKSDVELSLKLVSKQIGHLVCQCEFYYSLNSTKECVDSSSQTLIASDRITSFQEKLIRAKDLLKDSQWEPLPPFPKQPEEREKDCAERIKFKKEENDLKLWLDELNLDDTVKCLQNVELQVQSVNEMNSLSFMRTADFEQFAKLQSNGGSFSYLNFQKLLQDLDLSTQRLKLSPPEGQFFFPKGELPFKAENARKDITKASVFLRSRLFYEYRKRQVQSLGLVLLCCATGKDDAQLNTCASLLESTHKTMERCLKPLFKRKHFLHVMDSSVIKISTSFLELSKALFSQQQRKVQPISSANQLEDLELFFDFNQSNIQLLEAIPSLHLISQHESGIVPSVRNVFLKMRCTNANPEQMLSKFRIFNDSVAVSARFQIVSIEDDPYDISPREGTISPMSLTELNITFNSAVLSAARKENFLRKLGKYQIVLLRNSDERFGKENRVCFEIDGQLQSVDNCLSVDPTLVDFGSINLNAKIESSNQKLTINNSSHSSVKFVILNCDEEDKLTSSIKFGLNWFFSDKGKENRSVEFGKEYYLSALSSQTLNLRVKLKYDSVGTFTRQFIVRFPSGKEFKVTVQVRFVKASFTVYDCCSQVKLEDFQKIIVPKNSVPLVISNPFSVFVTLKIWFREKDTALFRLEPTIPTSVIAPNSSILIKVAQKADNKNFKPAFPDHLNIDDGTRCRIFEVMKPPPLSLIVNPSFCQFDPSSADTISPVPFYVKIREEKPRSYEVLNSVPEIKQNQENMGIVAGDGASVGEFYWALGSFLKRKSECVFRKTDLHCPEVVTTVEIKIQQNDVSIGFHDNNILCHLIGKECTVPFIILSDKHPVAAEVKVFSYGAKNVYVNKTELKSSKKLLLQERMQLTWSPEVDKNWYGIALKISAFKHFVAFNGKVFPQLRKLFLVGSAEPLQDDSPDDQSWQLTNVSADAADLAKEQLTQACNEEKLSSLLSIISSVLSVVTAEKKATLTFSVESLRDLAGNIKKSEELSFAGRLVEYVLRFTSNAKSSEFGLLLALKQSKKLLKGGQANVDWIADALVFPKSETVSPDFENLISAVQVLERIYKDTHAVKNSARKGFLHFLRLLEEFGKACHRLRSDSSSTDTIMVLKEIFFVQSSSEVTLWKSLGVLCATASNFASNKCKSAFDFIRYLKCFESLSQNASMRSLSIDLLLTAVLFISKPLSPKTISNYIAAAVDFSVSSSTGKENVNSIGSAVLRCVGEALESNPFVFPSLTTTVDLYCNVVECFDLPELYCNKVVKKMNVFPLIWQKHSDSFIYMADLLSAFISDQITSDNKVVYLIVELIRNFASSGSDYCCRCVKSYGNLLSHWFETLNCGQEAIKIKALIDRTLQQDFMSMQLKGLFTSDESEKVRASLAEHARTLRKCMKTSRNLIDAFETIAAAIEIIAESKRQEFMAFHLVLKDFVNLKKGNPFDFISAAFEIVARLAQSAEFKAALSDLNKRVRILRKSLFETNLMNIECLSEIRFKTSSHLFQLLSSFLYCQSIASQSQPSSFGSLKRVLNKGLLSTKLAVCFESDILSLPSALLDLASLFCRPAEAIMCGKFAASAKDHLNNCLKKEKLLARLLISQAKDCDSKQFVLEHMEDIIFAMSQSKTLPKVLLTQSSQSLDNSEVLYCFAEKQWYGFGTSEFLLLLEESKIAHRLFPRDIDSARSTASDLKDEIVFMTCRTPYERKKQFPMMASKTFFLLCTLCSKDSRALLETLSEVFCQWFRATQTETISCESSMSLFVDLISCIPATGIEEGLKNLKRKAEFFSGAALEDMQKKKEAFWEKLTAMLTERTLIDVRDKSWLHFRCFLYVLEDSQEDFQLKNIVSKIKTILSLVFDKTDDVLKTGKSLIDKIKELQNSQYDDSVLKEFFDVVYSSNWFGHLPSLIFCDMTAVEKPLLRGCSVTEFEESMRTLTDLAYKCGLIEDRNLYYDYIAIIQCLLQIAHSSCCSQEKVLDLLNDIFSFLKAVYKENFQLTGTDVGLVLQHLYKCWKIEETSKSYERNWERYVSHGICAALSWLLSVAKNKSSIEEADISFDCNQLLLDSAAPDRQIYLSSEVEEIAGDFNLDFPESKEALFLRSVSVDSDLSSSKLKSSDDLRSCTEGEEEDSDEEEREHSEAVSGQIEFLTCTFFFSFLGKGKMRS